MVNKIRSPATTQYTYLYGRALMGRRGVEAHEGNNPLNFNKLNLNLPNVIVPNCFLYDTQLVADAPVPQLPPLRWTLQEI